LVRDVVITGEGRHAPGAILFLDPAARALDLAVLRARLRDALRAYNRANAGSSTMIARVAIALDEPSPATGEVSDKGSLNQRVCRTRRAALVAALHGADISADIIDLEHPAEEARP
ncbi:MAG: feruloyl-CoA synthase, partial [Alphaproteobacteria bacterium]|nr:feruloyl-CoA synthase [Alphaproteobacteria bacterium]